MTSSRILAISSVYYYSSLDFLATQHFISVNHQSTVDFVMTQSTSLLIINLLSALWRHNLHLCSSSINHRLGKDITLHLYSSSTYRRFGNDTTLHLYFSSTYHQLYIDVLFLVRYIINEIMSIFILKCFFFSKKRLNRRVELS